MSTFCFATVGSESSSLENCERTTMAATVDLAEDGETPVVAVPSSHQDVAVLTIASPSMAETGDLVDCGDLAEAEDLAEARVLAEAGDLADAATNKALHFSGGGHHHSSHLVSVARACATNGAYTDVRLQLQDGELRAHRLVLAACSHFLRDALLGLPPGLSEFTLVLPGIRVNVAKTLIDFLYTVRFAPFI